MPLKRNQFTCYNSTNKVSCIKVKQLEKNAFKQKENQKEQERASRY